MARLSSSTLSPTVSNHPANGENASAGGLKAELLAVMLEASKRTAVPIRSRFVQSLQPDADGVRKGPLADLVHDPAALDAYLLIHATASPKDPYDVHYRANAWALVSGMQRGADEKSARTRWSRTVTKLVKAKLITRLGNSRRTRYLLLDESGSGEAYSRPKTVSDGTWFSLPHIYWLEGWNEKLSAAEKVMLLIALSSKPGFELPYERVPQWYGLSPSTAQRGLTGLVRHGILHRYETTVADPRSKTLRRTIMKYTAQGNWAVGKRMKKRASDSLTFTP